MSNKNTNIADYLVQIENLTSTNLQILKAINDSFFTKKNHLFTEIGDTTYVIPSFLSLENKINMLQENFENLVKAPETSEAYFNIDGNTRAIEVKKYSHTPDSLVLPIPSTGLNTFSIDNNDVFKDFMTPIPYINISLPSLPNDIVEVNVKKIVAKSDSLKALFKTKLSYLDGETDENGKEIIKYYNAQNIVYGDIYKMLLNYNEDVDYIEYDTIYKLPIRKNLGSATYVIESVISDVINDDLEEIITLKLRNDLAIPSLSNTLTYKQFDDTIEKYLQVGDELVNFDGTGKVKITAIKSSTNTIEVKVVNGEYLNFVGTDSYDSNNDTDIHDLSKLRFHRANNNNNSLENTDKTIKIPLEKDQYIFIAVAALNSRMNIQSSWGKGIIVNTFELQNGDTKFKDYYDNNVKNLGDVLLEMSNMITSPITSLTQDEFNKLTNVKPNINSNMLSVMQINKHLNNSTTVKNIRNAYNQKKTAESNLAEVQAKINEINEKLTTISFNDTSGIRPAYVSQLSQYNRQKNELLAVINNAMNEISLNVNSAEIPIENAKYRIRGFYTPNLSNTAIPDINQHIIGLQVQYRYKNMSSTLGNAVTLNSADNATAYIYSDWNVLNTRNKLKIASYNNGKLMYNYEANNENINEPSYNQIDIPISQGESVDIKIKVVYDFGQPYITMTSDWSEIINIQFPDEYAKDVPVLTIIEENNNDIESNRFNNILETSGVNTHINDSFLDQNIIYFHKPDNIASGFYTAERKVIPLKDKLQSLSNDIAALKTDVQSAQSNCKVSVSIGNEITEIYSDRTNTIILEPYSSFNEQNIEEPTEKYINGAYTLENGIVSTMVNISIVNTSANAMKLYPLFPGSRTIFINDIANSIYPIKNYCIDGTTGNNAAGVFFAYNSNSSDTQTKLQTQNQFITFRINDPWTGTKYYDSNEDATSNNLQTATELPNLENCDTTSMVIYPYLNTEYGLCVDNDSNRSYLLLNPGEEIIIPMYCGYYVDEEENIMKTISFDIRNSLFTDPINYTFEVVAKNKISIQDKLSLNNKRALFNRPQTSLLYENTIK